MSSRSTRTAVVVCSRRILILASRRVLTATAARVLMTIRIVRAFDRAIALRSLTWLTAGPTLAT